MLGTERVYVDDQVEVIYFPTRQHIKIAIGDTAFGNECPDDYCVRTSMQAINRLTTSSLAGGPQYRIKIKVTQNELDDMLRFVENGTFAKRLTCAHSVCSTLNRNTTLWAPFPVSISPAASAIYLSLLRLIPGSRVIGVRFIPRGLKWGDIPTSITTTMEFGMVFGVVYAGSIFIYDAAVEAIVE